MGTSGGLKIKLGTKWYSYERYYDGFPEYVILILKRELKGINNTVLRKLNNTNKLIIEDQWKPKKSIRMQDYDWGYSVHVEDDKIMVLMFHQGVNLGMFNIKSLTKAKLKKLVPY